MENCKVVIVMVGNVIPYQVDLNYDLLLVDVVVLNVFSILEEVNDFKNFEVREIANNVAKKENVEEMV